MSQKTTIMTISKAIEQIKLENPDCYLSRRLILDAINSGKLGCVEVGVRKLVNVDCVKEYLAEMCLVKNKRPELPGANE